jgi:hypothetical protein
MLDYPEAEDALIRYDELRANNPDLPIPERDILYYNYAVQAEGNHIDYEYAHHEIQQHMLNFVRVGIMAHKMQYLKLWKKRFLSFREYCEKGLGKKYFQIRDYIRAAKVVLSLASDGFTVLPTCPAQAIELFPYFQKSNEELASAWNKVIYELPAPLITVMAIKRVLGHKLPKPKITVNEELRETLTETALSRGMTVEEMLMADYGLATEEEPEVTEVSEEKMTTWQDDLKSLVEEHDAGKWLLCALAKLIKPRNRYLSLGWGAT